MNWLRERSRRNVVFLACALSLGMGSLAMNLVVAPLAGYALAPDPTLSTLPLAILFIGMMVSTFPASMLMNRIGRRLGFLTGNAAGVLGALLAMKAMIDGSFLLLCIGTSFLGCANAFVQYYRFAAADTASDDFRPTAISLVMAGGVAAGLIGPNYATLSRDWLAPHAFAGAYLAMISLFVGSALAVAFLRIPRPSAIERKDSGRPIGQIALQPMFIVAVLCSTVAYCVMNFVMTSTPLAILGCGYGFGDAAFIIQWHAIAMFAPSFFTGSLIKRFGVLAIMTTGAMINLLAIAFHAVGIDLIVNFLPGMMLLGLGWNFLFIGATTLLTETYRPEERAKAQGTNDFIVFSFVALVSLASGPLYSRLGWTTLNLIALVPLAIILITLGAMMTRRNPTRAVA
jgi:MFS family permease